MDKQEDSRILDWVEILEAAELGDDITLESLARFHDRLWSDLDATLDRILGSR